MKTLLTLATGLVLLSLGLGSWRPASAAQDPAAPSLDQRVAALEEKLATLERQDKETRALLEQTVTYLEKHGKAASTLSGVLDESQEQGFTVGENWKSRETLLTGLRAYLADGQSGLPKLPAPPPAPKPTPGKRPPGQ